MNLKIKKSILLESLNYVSKALSSRNIIPILNGIKFELTKKGLSITATDNEISINTFISKENILLIKEEGSLIIYGKYLLEIIRKLPSDQVEIYSVENNKAIITTKTSKYDLNCYDINDFPKIDFKADKKPIIINSNIFLNIINKTLFATSTQESRPVLTGLNIKIQGNLLECIGTDSYRLAKKIYKIEDMVDENINIIIPSKSLIELIKILEDNNESLELNITENKILFKYKNVLFQSSLLNGTFPNTNNSIPTEFEIQFKVNLNEIYNVIDRASLLTQFKEKNIITLEQQDTKLIINSSSQEIGKVEEIMNCEKIKGDKIKISFNSKYMLDALKTFTSENIILNFNGELKPIIISSSEETELTQLILPIKTF